MSDVSVREVNQMIETTDHWGFVKTPYGELYLAGNDDGIAMRYYHGKEYEPESLAVWASLCDNAVVIDVGAHTGIYSLAAYRSGARTVSSVEPYYLNMARLKMNLKHAGYTTLRCVYACAGSDSGTSSIAYNGTTAYCTTGGRVGPYLNWPTLPVPMVTLDRVAPMATVIKIDVESNTLDVLAGMTRLLQHTPAILIEATEAEIYAVLRPYGYTFSVLDGRNLYCTVP